MNQQQQQKENYTTMNFTDCQLNILREALDKSWLSLSCNDDNGVSIQGLNLSNEIDEIIKKNKQMDIDLEYNYNLHNELTRITDEEIKNLPQPPTELLEGLEDKETLINKAKDEIIEIYYNWRQNNKRTFISFTDFLSILDVNDINGTYEADILEKALKRVEVKLYKNGESIIDKAVDEIINCYESCRETYGTNNYSFGNFECQHDEIVLDNDYDDDIFDQAMYGAKVYFNRLYQEASIKLSDIKHDMNINKTFNKQTDEVKQHIKEYMQEYQESNAIYKRNSQLKYLADWDNFAVDFATKKEYRNFIKQDILNKIEL